MMLALVDDHLTDGLGMVDFLTAAKLDKKEKKWDTIYHAGSSCGPEAQILFWPKLEEGWSILMEISLTIKNNQSRIACTHC